MRTVLRFGPPEHWVKNGNVYMKYNFDQIYNLVTKAYLKARAEERSTEAQLEYEKDLEINNKILTKELYDRQWKPQPLDWFVNTIPTVREVFAPKFRDRIVSHVLFILISPIFERYFIFDSHSCRVGKGTLHGISRLEHHLRSVTNNYKEDAWVLNCDITGYFMSIDRNILYNIIQETISKHKLKFPEQIDYEFADYLIKTFLTRDPLDGCVYHGDPGRIKLVLPEKSLRFQKQGVGIPIGDVINQLFSNIYLNVLDQYVKRTLKIKGYDRYVDDAKLIHPSYEYLEYCKNKISYFLLSNLHLRLHPNKTTITNAYDGIFFLGGIILPYRKYVKNEVLNKFKTFFKDTDDYLKQNPLNDKNSKVIIDNINSRLGYLSHFNEYKKTFEIIKNSTHILNNFEFMKNLNKSMIKK